MLSIQWYDNQLSGWTEKFGSSSQSSTCLPKKFLVTCGLLPVWSTTAFWIPVKPWYLRSRLSKLMKCTENCNSCSQHWSRERAQFSSRKHPTACHTVNAWTNWAIQFCLIHHIHLTSCQLTTTSSRISTKFCRKKASIESRKQQMLSKNLSNLEA